VKTTTTKGNQPETKTRNPLLEDLELQKRLADYHFIAILKHMSFAWQKPAPAIHKRAVSRSQILNEILAVVIHYARVSARHLCFGIIFVEINIGEDPAVGITATDICFDPDYRELLTDSPASLDDQAR